jgi:hypothetical protein
MNFDELNGLDAIIIRSQTTYVIIRIGELQIRLNFKGKVEFHLAKNTGGTIILHNDHPLLLDYIEPWSDTYINTKPSNPECLLTDIKEAIYEVTEGWRNWTRYIYEHAIKRNIIEGNGLLMKAPRSVTKAVVKCCERQAVATYNSEGTYQPSPKKLLFIGKNYIIAEVFS